MTKYDFTNYYKQAYLQEKKNNIQLAAQAASQEQTVIELRQKYERIAGNPVMRLFHVVKRVPSKLKEGKKTKISDTVCNAETVSVKQYEKEVLFQRNPYALWMSEHEKPIQAEGSVSVVEVSDSHEKSSQTAVVYMEDCGASFDITALKKPYVLFVSKEGRYSSRTVKVIEEYFEKHGETNLLYSAEDTMYTNAKGERIRENPWFKPVYSPETLLSFFYFGNLFAVRTDKLSSLAWKKSANWKENIYDFVLKVEEVGGIGNAEKIAMLDEVLFHREADKEKTGVCEAKEERSDEIVIQGLWGYEKEFEEVKLDALKRRGLSGRLEETNVPRVYSVCIEEKDKISIVILSKDNQVVLEQCIRSIREKTDYENYEIIVVDNGSYEDNRLKVDELSRTYDFTYICEPMDFNFSAMCNMGAKAATGKYLLLLNDDMEIIESGYLRKMAGQASVQGVGAVGAKLWYPNSLSIQHVGITNLAVGPAHKLVTAEDCKRYYDGRNYFTFNFLAVTGACLMIKKEIYEQVGGMDESMPIAYNDVEFCFRLHKKGYRNVLRNDCILFHHESLSRGLDEEDMGKAQRLLEERKRLYQKYPYYAGMDVYYSPWLIQDSPEYRCGGGVVQAEMVKPPLEENKGKRGKALKENVLVANIDSVRVTDNRAEICGWSVLLGADNCHYKRRLLLENVDTKKVYSAEILSYLREDVLQVYPGEIRAELSGLKAGFSVKAIPNGTYRIGVLYEDMLSNKAYNRMLDKYMEA